MTSDGAACAFVGLPHSAYSYWIPVLSYEWILCVMVVKRLIVSFMAQRVLNHKGMTLVDIMIRDSLLTFVTWANYQFQFGMINLFIVIHMTDWQRLTWYLWLLGWRKQWVAQNSRYGLSPGTHLNFIAKIPCCCIYLQHWALRRARRSNAVQHPADRKWEGGQHNCSDFYLEIFHLVQTDECHKYCAILSDVRPWEIVITYKQNCCLIHSSVTHNVAQGASTERYVLFFDSFLSHYLEEHVVLGAD